ncbi:unnamed protein product [Owenia fusiformis]|uniref:Uncharacterized protein n=1 Tax=Owenia fusiformis TaxID=6347 RepID=A0A8J1Y5P4_OWEFU|nr:unnamed protein product [Owenia fusiformis]
MMRVLYIIGLVSFGLTMVQCREVKAKKQNKIKKELNKVLMAYQAAWLLPECATKMMPNCSKAAMSWSKTAILAGEGCPTWYGQSGIQQMIEYEKKMYPDRYLTVEWERVTGTKSTAFGFGLCKAIRKNPMTGMEETMRQWRMFAYFCKEKGMWKIQYQAELNVFNGAPMTTMTYGMEGDMGGMGGGMDGGMEGGMEG